MSASDQNDRHRPIAIVGMGSLFPNAQGLHEYWRLIRRGEDGLSEVPDTHWSLDDYFDTDRQAADRTYCRRGGFLSPTPFDPVEYGIPPTVLEATDTAQLLSLIVAKAALKDAGYGDELREFDRTRTGVILGVTGTQELVIPLGARLSWPAWKRALLDAGVTAEVADDVVERISETYVEWQENSFPGLLGNVVAGRIANRLNLKGTNCVVDAACASSLSALHLAMLELSAGKSDMMVTGGVDTLNDIFMFMCFSKTQALSPSGDARPFSKSADGTVIGEGVGMLVLKRLEDARRDGDRVYAVIRGMGTSSDGRAESIYAPRAEGQAEALRNAYRISGVEPRTVELVEAHGTGTKVGDVVEFEGIKTVYRESKADGCWCAIGSVKSQIGHTKAAAGVASIVKAALSLHHKVLPPTIKVDEPHPKMEIDKSPFYISTELRPWLAGGNRPRRAAVSAFGFGGSNFHAVMEEYDAVKSEPAWDGSVQLIALSADSPDALAHMCGQWQKDVQGGLRPEELAYRAMQSRQAFSPNHAHRLVLVAEYGDDQGALWPAAEEAVRNGGQPAPLCKNKIFYGTNGPAGKLAMLFPGQASQYPYMGRDLMCIFPEAFGVLSAAAGQVSLPVVIGELIYPRPTFDENERREQQARLTRTELAQPAIGTVCAAMFRVLERFGLQPDMTAGHSFGELPALLAAGRIDEKTLLDLSAQRGKAMAEHADGDGTMLAVHAPTEELDGVLSEAGLDVVLANRNAPMQSVLSGSREGIEQAVALCERQGWRCTPLSVSGAFHSQLMEKAEKRFRKTLDEAEFKAGRCPVYANATGKSYPRTADRLREMLAGQLTRPVNWVEVVNNLYDDGVRTFVEVGPKKVLTGLVSKILGDRSATLLAMDESAGRGSGLTDLARMLARLAADGYAIDLKAWERKVDEPRKMKMVVPLLGANYRSEKKKKPRPRKVATQPQTEQIANSNMNGQSAMQNTNVNNTSHGMQNTSAPQTAGQPTMSNDALTGVYQVVQEGLRAMQALQQQTATAHQRFLETQESAHRSFQMLMESQQRMIERAMGLPVSPMTTQPAPAPPAPAPVAQPAPPANDPRQLVEAALRAAVSEKTGYAADMIQMNMELESDLGIDLVRRVEVMDGLKQRLGDWPMPSADMTNRFSRLNDIVEYMLNPSAAMAAPAVSAPAPATPVAAAEPEPASSGAADGFEPVLLEVVSELTGYPVEMLDTNMDMEADLGIDSIKRVEILASVQSRMPNLKAVDSSYMGSLRTLRNIVEYMTEDGGNGAADGNGNGAADGAHKKKVHRELADNLQRQVLRPVELTEAVAGELAVADDGEIWITDDGTTLARELVRMLKARGCTARAIEPGKINGKLPAPPAGVIVLAPPHTDSDGEITPDSEAFLTQIFSLVKKAVGSLREFGGKGGALLAAVSRMDGSFGLDGGVYDPVMGGLAGLVKTAAHEWPEVRCKVLDIAGDWDDAAAVAEAIVEELAADGPIEVGRDRERRYGLVLEDIVVQGGPLPCEKGDVVVVTGGARGVTAETAIALAEHAQPTLVLLGRSPLPESEPAWLQGIDDAAGMKRAILQNEFTGQRPSPAELEQSYRRYQANREIGETLRRIESAGGRAVYRPTDVRDGKVLARTLDNVRKEFGAIRGVIHAAGVLQDHLIADKTAEQFAQVFETKVAGLRHLLAATADDDLRFMVLFSSVTARFGRQGQVDYAMANEVLNKVAHQQRRRRPTCRVVSINWGPWDGGMVTPSLKKEFNKLGIELIGLRDGAEAMVRELCGDGQAVEVVIGGAFPQAALPNAQPAAESNGSLHVVFRRDLDVAQHAFMNDHVIGGRSVLPLAMILEWFAHAAMHDNPGLQLIGLDGLRVLKGVAVEQSSPALQWAVGGIDRCDDGYAVDAELRGQASGGREMLHARGKVLLGDAILPPPSVDAEVEAISTGGAVRGRDEIYREILFHGPKFHCIDNVRGCSRAGIVADLATSPAPGQWMQNPPRKQWLTEPLAIDGVLQLGIVWGFEQHGQLSLPSYIHSYRQYVSRWSGPQVTAVLRMQEVAPPRIRADVDLLDAQGALVAQLAGVEWTMDGSLKKAFGRDLVGA